MKTWLVNLLGKFLPADYKPSIAIKKAAYISGKLAIAFMVGSKAGPYIQAHTTPDQLLEVQGAISTASGVILEVAHDFLKMRFPNITWL